MSHAQVQNKEGNFIHASLETVRNAVAAEWTALPKGDGSREAVTITNARGANSYPIASFSYLLVYKELSTNPRIDSMEKAKALENFIHWAITDGQQFADDLSYVPLPEEVVNHNMETLSMLTYRGQSVFEATGGQQAPSLSQTTFAISSTYNGNSYTITGKSEKAKVVSFRINIEIINAASHISVCHPITLDYQS